MILAVRKEPNGLVYIDKNIYYDNRFGEQILSQPPYNYIKVEINEQYLDCISSDFNEDLSFNIEKYNARKLKENTQQKIDKLKEKLKATDYQAIKFAEGEMQEKDFLPIKKQRQIWRNEINNLEALINE